MTNVGSNPIGSFSWNRSSSGSAYPRRALRTGYAIPRLHRRAGHAGNGDAALGFGAGDTRSYRPPDPLRDRSEAQIGPTRYPSLGRGELRESAVGESG